MSKIHKANTSLFIKLARLLYMLPPEEVHTKLRANIPQWQNEWPFDGLLDPQEAFETLTNRALAELVFIGAACIVKSNGRLLPVKVYDLMTGDTADDQIQQAKDDLLLDTHVLGHDHSIWDL